MAENKPVVVDDVVEEVDIMSLMDEAQSVFSVDSESHAAKSPVVQESNTTYQANVLITNRRAWTAQETKLFYLTLKKIKPQLNKDGLFTDYTKELYFTWTPAEIAKSFGTDWIRKYMEKICDGLWDKGKFKIPTEHGFRMIPLFNLIEWDKRNGLTIEFCKYMTAYLVDLAGKHYTKIQFESVFKLSSAHAIRLLELVLTFQNQRTKRKAFAYETLREYFGIEDGKYKRFWNFEKKVLDDPAKEINASTPYYVEYKVIRAEGTVLAIELSISIKQIKIGEIEYDTTKKKKVERALQSLKAIERIASASSDEKKRAIEVITKKYGSGIIKIATGLIEQEKKRGSADLPKE